MTNQITQHATRKIVMILLFICFSIMTFSMIYKMKQSKTTTLFPADVGILLSAPRTVGAFELLTNNKNAFTEKNLMGHWTLLFFGFSHCNSICPATMTVLSPVYKNLIKTNANLQVALVSLDPERDSPSVIHQYVKSFHPAFIGVTGTLTKIRKLQAQFGVYSKRDSLGSDQSDQIMHTASIMLIDPKGQWIALFKPDTPPAIMSGAIQKAIDNEQIRA